MSGIETPLLSVEQEEEVTVAPERKGLIERLQKIPFIARVSKHVPAGKFGRYLLVGIWNTLFGLIVFVALNTALTNVVPYSYVVASVLSSLICWTVAYLGYKIFVFKTKGNYVREWLRCAVVYSSSMVLNTTLLPILVTTTRYFAHFAIPATGNLVFLRSHHFLYRILTIPNFAYAILVFVGAIYSFLGHSKFSFRPAE